MAIPLVDLYAQYLSIQSDIDSAIQSTIKSSGFIGGKVVSDFEFAFAEFTGSKHCISCANGTDSLEIILQALGIGPNDEVIVPAISWISTSEAVSSVGAKPVFVDIEAQYFSINTDLIEAKINKKTKAIIPVHLYGHPANMDKIMEIARKYNVKVIEDCAQAHAAQWNGRMVGTFGHASSYSFYPGKNLGAYGDAGAMMTDDSTVAEKLRMIANHGQKGKHIHIMEGRNSRMDSLQAAILSAKLPYLNNWIESRITHADFFDRHIQNESITKPKVHTKAKHVYHLYVLRTESRAELMQYLEANDVSCAIHYPTALPFLPCYAHLHFTESDFPMAFKLQSEILSIPLYPELTEDQKEYIVGLLNEF